MISASEIQECKLNQWKGIAIKSHHSRDDDRPLHTEPRPKRAQALERQGEASCGGCDQNDVVVLCCTECRNDSSLSGSSAVDQRVCTIRWVKDIGRAAGCERKEVAERTRQSPVELRPVRQKERAQRVTAVKQLKWVERDRHLRCGWVGEPFGVNKWLSVRNLKDTCSLIAMGGSVCCGRASTKKVDCSCSLRRFVHRACRSS